ncbi:hypothetical protein CW696_05975 [ANME-2 cluster archaeon]|nr:MAG: hypothetical protein CW696_05975 [ANME-2 cluster archaeon]
MNANELIRPLIISLLIAALIGVTCLIGEPFHVKGGGASTYWMCVELAIVFVLPASPIVYEWVTHRSKNWNRCGHVPHKHQCVTLSKNATTGATRQICPFKEILAV